MMSGKPVSSFTSNGLKALIRCSVGEFPFGARKKARRVSQRRPVVERLRLVRNTPLEEYRFVSRETEKPAKVTLIGPDRISQRFDWQNSKTVYSNMDNFMDDVVQIQREMIRGLVGAGCRYVQID